jgi:hypothetical protein
MNPIGRFQVMALLQAARAFVLGLPLEQAKSWGLNRAIFYAAAKRGFRGTSQLTKEFQEAKKRGEKGPAVFRLGDEMAFTELINGKQYFRIGGKVQTDEDFKRQIEWRFGPIFKEAWREAIELVSRYDRKTLLSQREFYERVYRPYRDALSEKWSSLYLEVRKARGQRE